VISRLCTVTFSSAPRGGRPLLAGTSLARLWEPCVGGLVRSLLARTIWKPSSLSWEGTGVTLRTRLVLLFPRTSNCLGLCWYATCACSFTSRAFGHWRSHAGWGPPQLTHFFDPWSWGQPAPPWECAAPAQWPHRALFLQNRPIWPNWWHWKHRRIRRSAV
jgi:hypothetical protein